MPPNDQLGALVAQIAGRRFTAGDVMDAVKIDQNALTNLLNKSNLRLCSEPLGKGRPRQFPLIDVYQIGLFASLSAVTGRVKWAADATNHLLFKPTEEAAVDAEMKALGLATDFDRSRLRRDLDFDDAYAKFKNVVSDNIKRAPKCYWSRDRDDPYLLVADSDDVTSGDQYTKIIKQSAFPSFQAFIDGVVVRLTNLFETIDWVLADNLKERDAQ